MTFYDVMGMRLIDANVVINTLENDAKKTSGEGQRRRLELARMLRQQPTIPLYDLVIHAYWTKDHKCSHCGHKACYDECEYHEGNFCSFCGAEMNLKRWIK